MNPPMHTKTTGRLRPAALILASTVLLAVGAQAVAADMGSRPADVRVVVPAATPQGPTVVPDRSDLLAMRADRRVRALRRPAVALERIGASGGSVAGLGSGIADWSAVAACESGGRWEL